ncbi:MAG: PA0069 family radical SAM protein [Planctomycetota bacterium]
MDLPGPRGRGAARDLPNRFREVWTEPELGERLEEGWLDEEDVSPRTELIEDASRSILSENQSPDIPFRFSLNPYRGCEQGCAYCYARPGHEYLGYSAGLEFESKIVFKPRAAELLREALGARRWQPQTIAMSGVTDCYQPVERRLGLTRACLEVLLEHRNPAAIITKSHGVVRDRDLLAELAGHGAAAVNLTITTLDPELSGALEPRASRPARRLAAIRALREAGVPVGVMVAPVIPGLTDHELPAILAAAAEAGASWAGWILLRLPLAVEPLFVDWLDRHAPARKAKVLGRLRDLRGGRLNEPRFGARMRGEGPLAAQLAGLFQLGAQRAGLGAPPSLSAAAFRRPRGRGAQLELFGGA